MVVERNPHPLKVDIVRFPGSNCDFDTLRFFLRFGHDAQFLWHKETKTHPGTDLVVLPGGFAFGDRRYEQATGAFTIEPGVQALETPIMAAVMRRAKAGGKTFGICNGFQILTHAGLLPGRLEQNESKRFFCDDVDCRVEGGGFFNDRSMVNTVYRINVAHGYGNYQVDEAEYKRMLKNGQVFLRYHGLNPNGSFADIAGVCNPEKDVFAMMPHPERTDPVTQQVFMSAIEKYVRR